MDQPPGTQRDARAPRDDSRRALGSLGEELASAHMRRLGFEVLDRGARSRHGEIDLIVCDGRTIVFAEVKTQRARRRARTGRLELQPLSWLSRPQRARIRKLASAWLSEPGRDRPSARLVRFDAIGVIVDGDDRLVRLDHLENAW